MGSLVAELRSDPSNKSAERILMWSPADFLSMSIHYFAH